MKTILAPLSGSERDRCAIAHALAIAAPLGAHVTALLPGGPLSEFVPAELSERGSRARQPFLRHAQEELARQADAARRLFAETAREAGAVTAEVPPGGGAPAALDAGATIWFEVRRGDDARAIREAAVLHDVILFHRDAEGPDAGTDASPRIKDALEAAGRPLLVLPARLPEPPFAATVGIAWNGSVEGAHAVAAAMPFLGRARAVHVLTAATAKTEAARGEELRRYLGWHGIVASVHPVATGGAPVGAALLAAAGEVGADLLVMGGYSRGRLRQRVLGGVTHHVLRRASLPVLLSR